MATSQARRSQKQRSDLTRAALLDAAIKLIHDQGLTRTSTIDIARAAGVSRGALTHHFESREELIASAIEHMLLSTIKTLTEFTDEFIAGEGKSDDIVDFLWGVMNDRLFPVTLEFLPEARHNDAFRQRLLPVVSAWHQALDRIWAGLAIRYRVEPEFVRILMNGTLCLFRGMIAQSVLRDDAPYFAGLLHFWKRDVEAQLMRASASSASGKPSSGKPAIRRLG